MSPSDLEEYIEQRPVPTLRLTLSSGDQLVVGDEDRPILQGLVLLLRGGVTERAMPRHRLISVPNIVLVEPLAGRPRTGRKRR